MNLMLLIVFFSIEQLGRVFDWLWENSADAHPPCLLSSSPSFHLAVLVGVTFPVGWSTGLVDSACSSSCIVCSPRHFRNRMGNWKPLRIWRQWPSPRWLLPGSHSKDAWLACDFKEVFYSVMTFSSYPGHSQRSANDHEPQSAPNRYLDPVEWQSPTCPSLVPERTRTDQQVGARTSPNFNPCGVPQTEY